MSGPHDPAERPVPAPAAAAAPALTGRDATVAAAAALGADDAALDAIRAATIVSRSATIVLPAHHYETLSRGRGWARKGKGYPAVWGERLDAGGYRVGPGRWTVGGNDGFARRGAASWTVTAITIGAQTWTVAS